MFCPKCSRQQMSDHIRFCSHCGFQLNLVKALLVAGDDSSSATSESIAANRSRRKRDITIGALLMLFFALHSAWTTEDLSLEREYTSLIVKCLILCVLINIMPVIRDFFYDNKARNIASSPKMLSRLIAKFENNDQKFALPAAAYGRPAADYISGRITTAELIPPQPRSVTDDTTNLLRNN